MVKRFGPPEGAGNTNHCELLWCEPMVLHTKNRHVLGDQTLVDTPVNSLNCLWGYRSGIQVLLERASHFH
jgi:hypothetical protein